MSEENNRFSGSLRAVSFTAGGMVGAVLAMLFAPWEGRKTRSKLKEMAGEVKEKTSQRSKDWREKASHFMVKRREVEQEVPPPPQQAPLEMGSEQNQVGAPSIELG